jgi:hypothetical protein
MADQNGGSGAVAFWERGRIVYNAVLVVIVLLWVVFTWPHFRPSLTLGSLEAMIVLGLMANLCYCAAYAAEPFLQGFVSQMHRLRLRWVLWVVGMLFAILLENYWIGDEIYPAANEPPPAIIGGTAQMPTATFASNINFPAPLGVLGFLAGAGGLFVGLASMLIFWFAKKPRSARMTAIALGLGAAGYFVLLLGFSAKSEARMLARGQEKYFCEIDCHLAYSVVDVKEQAESAGMRYIVTLRTRFDETTTSPSRPKDAPLTPSPREVKAIDGLGHEYHAATLAGTPLLTALKPGESFTTQLEFSVPANAPGLRLLIRTAPAWPDHLVIGDENSWLHRKTYFAL